MRECVIVGALHMEEIDICVERCEVLREPHGLCLAVLAFFFFSRVLGRINPLLVLAALLPAESLYVRKQ